MVEEDVRFVIGAMQNMLRQFMTLYFEGDTAELSMSVGLYKAFFDAINKIVEAKCGQKLEVCIKLLSFI